METIYINPLDTHPNLFQGFGTSLSWFGVGISDKKEVDFLSNLLFNPSNPLGLQLNIVRYNIGGSNKNTHEMRKGGNVPEYVNNDGTDDENQVYFLKKSFEHGARIFEAFSNSPPMGMTVSGQTSGANPWKILKRFGNIGFSNNLKWSKIEEFTTYLVDVTTFLSKSEIPFTSISPINEPSSPGWINGNNQEGCFYGFFGIRRKIFSSLRKKTEGTGLEVAGFEENNMLQALIGLLINPSIKIDKYNVHRYKVGNALGFNTKGVEDSNLLRKIIRYLVGKTPIWISEAGFGYENGISNYNDIQNSLNFASKLMDDLIFLKPTAWVYWQVIEDLSNNGWGCMQVDFNNPGSKIYGSQYTAFQHFTHFIKPGHRILNVIQPSNKNLKIVASFNPKNKAKSIIILSNNDKEVKLEIKGKIFKKMESFGDKNSTTVETENYDYIYITFLTIRSFSLTSIIIM